MRLRNVLSAALIGLAAAARDLPFAQIPAPRSAPDHLRAGRRGAGISMAQQQRAATKKRNRERHRRACR